MSMKNAPCSVKSLSDSVESPSLAAAKIHKISALLIVLLMNTTALSTITLARSGMANSLRSEFAPLRIAGPESGELVMVNAQTDSTLRPWDSAQLTGKARLIVHMSDVEQSHLQLTALFNALKRKAFDSDYYQTTAVIDLSDASWSTRLSMVREIGEFKEQTPLASYVLDHEGRFRQALGLTGNKVAFYVLDSRGQVMHFGEGKPTYTDLDITLHFLEREVTRLKHLQTTAVATP